MADKAINALPVRTAPTTGDKMLMIGAAEEYQIDYDQLATAILNKLSTQNFSSLDTTSKTVLGAIDELNSKTIFANNAGFHNSIYRGKNLGTSFTSAMSSAIQDGTFDDLFVGDYMTINGTVYRVAGFNLIKNCGDTNFSGNNMCLVPDSALYNASMNSTNTTEGAYTNSEMRATNLEQATTKITTDFGSSHVISYRDILANATSNGQASGWAWTDCKVELMSEVMVYGTKVWGDSGYEVGCLNEQFPLFRLNPESIHRRFDYWLRSVRSSPTFARADGYGYAAYTNASSSLGVRPFFFVH